MPRAMLRRSLPILALVGLLAVPAGAAQRLSQSGAARPGAAGTISGQLLEWLTLTWARYAVSVAPNDRVNSASKAQRFNGCILDPNGRCAPAATTQGDSACGMDPNGICAAAATPQLEGGCIIDPNGVCRH